MVCFTHFPFFSFKCSSLIAQRLHHPTHFVQWNGEFANSANLHMNLVSLHLLQNIHPCLWKETLNSWFHVSVGSASSFCRAAVFFSSARTSVNNLFVPLWGNVISLPQCLICVSHGGHTVAAFHAKLFVCLKAVTIRSFHFSKYLFISNSGVSSRFPFLGTSGLQYVQSSELLHRVSLLPMMCCM